VYTILFSYKIAYKVATSYTPYKLVYGLHPLMPIKYVMSAINVDHKDAEPTKVLTTKIIDLEKLQVNKLKI
jgi:nitrate reductase beta subunit